ncbi:MAG TPA: hypothetical protein VNX68_02530, partial [Nitrosopumilaceae archaeon]|nr:hypothetical protein [Nitrosopumilaceae archaeon]
MKKTLTHASIKKTNRTKFTWFSIGLLFIGMNSFSQQWLWAKAAGGQGVQEGWAMASDVSGNVYVTGTFNSRFISFG